MKTNDVIKRHDLLDNFILASQLEGKNPKTIERYINIIDPFLTFINKEPLEAILSDFRAYLGHLSSSGYAKATVWTAYKNLHVFYEFLRREGRLKDNPMKLVSKPKLPRVYPKILTDKEIKALLVTAKSKGTIFIRRRNFALVCLLFDSGLRASEGCGIQLDDLSLDSQVVKVVGKGSKERVVPFSSETAKALKGYLKVRGNLAHETSFFVTQQGNNLSRYRIFKIIKELALIGGLDQAKVSPHVLRHSFATSWIRAGGDGKKLQAILGHSDGRIVDIYIHLTGVDLVKAHKEFSPLNGLLKE